MNNWADESDFHYRVCYFDNKLSNDITAAFI